MRLILKDKQGELVMMNRSLLIYGGITAVSLFFMMLQIAFTRYSIVRNDQLQDKIDKINADLRVLDAEVRLRDSMLFRNIEGSYRKIEELTEIRKMNQKQIDSLHDVILDDIKKIEDLKANLLKW
jgi:peptidoglycan hydrolase CwlO-like protein